MSRLLLFLAAILAVVVPAGAAERVALVIGNAAYSQVGVLYNTRNDAEAIAAALEAQGFEVTTALDQTLRQMDAALVAFRAKADAADIALVYYAGHGMEVGGQNYLIPVDASLIDERDVPRQAVPVNHLLLQISGARKLKMVVLDACRNNPFLSRMVRLGAGRGGGDQGLAAVSGTADNTLIAYAAAAGAVTPDGTPGGNSPYTASFLEALAGPPRDVRLLLGAVRDGMRSRTGPGAEPFVYSSIGAERLILNPKGEAPEPAVAAPPPPPAATEGAIREAEELLVRLGLHEGAPGGTLTPAVSAALGAFQRENSLPVTGSPDRATLIVLRTAARYASYAALSEPTPEAAPRTALAEPDPAAAAPEPAAAAPNPPPPPPDAPPWERRFPAQSWFGSITVLPDRGLAVAGVTARPSSPTWDGWLLRLDPSGDEVWRQRFAGRADDRLRSVAVLPDGGLLAAGETDGGSQNAATDAWIVRMDSIGRVQSERRIDGSASDNFAAIARLAQGGLVAAGGTGWGDSGGDGWLVSLDADGTEVWRRSYGGATFDDIAAVAGRADGGIVAAGYTQVAADRADWDAWLLRLDPTGEEVWQHSFSFGADTSELGFGVAALADGGTVAVGATDWGTPDSDGWVLRLDAAGDELWRRTFDSGGGEWLRGVAVLPEGGFLVAGATNPREQQGDGWLLRLDDAGDEVWRRSFGGPKHEEFWSVAALPDGGIALVGEATSDSDDLGIGWILRLNAFGEGPDEVAQLRQTCAGSAPTDGDAALSVQTSLTARGYDTARDGAWGAAATRALERFRANGGCDDAQLVAGR